MGWTGLAIAAVLRISLITVVMLIWYPMLLLPNRPQWSRPDRLAAAVMLGLVITVVTAHLLVPLHLFELLGYALVLLCLLLFVRYRIHGAQAISDLINRPLRAVFGALDRLTGSETKLGWDLKQVTSRIRFPPMGVDSTLWSSLLIGSIVAVAAVVRLGDALQSAAIAPSDFVEHLQWMKWLTLPDRGLFPDWVYPRGMNAVFATLRFLSQEEAQVLLRVGGPLLNLLALLAMLYTVHAITKSAPAAALAGGLFALAPVWLPTAWERQAAPLPQEFAMALLLPALWWSYRFIRDGDPFDRFLAASAALVGAATHWLVLLYLGTVYALAVMTGRGGSDWIRRSATLALWVVTATVIGLMPQVIALAFGTRLLPTAVEFASTGAAQTAGFASFAWPVGLLILSLALLSVRRPNRDAWLLPGVLGLWTLIHLLPALGISVLAVSARSWDFLAYIIPAAAGGALAGLLRFLPPAWTSKRSFPLALTGCVALVLTGAAVTAPLRILRLEPELTHEVGLTVLQLKNALIPGSWMMVGRPELLALVLGVAHQVDSDHFVTNVAVPPAGRTLGDSLIASSLLPPDTPLDRVPAVYLLVESNPLVSPSANASGLGPAIRSDTAKLRQWLDAYTALHGAPDTFYHSPSLVVYRIQPMARRN